MILCLLLRNMYLRRRMLLLRLAVVWYWVAPIFDSFCGLRITLSIVLPTAFYECGTELLALPGQWWRNSFIARSISKRWNLMKFKIIEYYTVFFDEIKVMKNYYIISLSKGAFLPSHPPQHLIVGILLLLLSLSERKSLEWAHLVYLCRIPGHILLRQFLDGWSSQ